MNVSLTKRIASAGLRRAILLGLVGALVIGVVVANAVTSTTLGGGGLTLAKESFSDDADVAVASKRIFKQGSTVAAVGDSAPGLEATDTLPQVTNGKGAGAEYAYEFEVKEAAVNSWQIGENFKIEVYMDDGTTTSLLATLYTQQGTVDDVNVEGVTVTAFTGLANALGNVFSIIITRQ